MNRRDLLRRAVGAVSATVAATGSAAPREFAPGYDASKSLARADWKPVFLDAHQNETLIALSDIVIPATDTLGAKDALVNHFIDEVMAAEKPEAQRDFLNGLAVLDCESLDRYKDGVRSRHSRPAARACMVAGLPAVARHLERFGRR